MSRLVVRYALWVGGSALLALLSVIAYYHRVKKILPVWNDWHEKLMNAGMGEPLQYRVLSYWIPELFIRLTEIEPWRAYLLERFVFLFLVALIFQRFSRRWLSGMESALAVVGFFYLYHLTLYAHFQPAEEINLLFFLLGLIAIERGRFVWLLAIVALGTLNKQTVVFLVPIYWTHQALQGKGFQADVILRTLSLTASFWAVRYGVRWSLGDRPYFSSIFQYGYNLKKMGSGDLRHWYFVLPSLLPLALILASWRRQPLLMRAIAPTIVLFVGAHFVIARVLEFRTHMPLAFVTLPAAILFARPYIDRDS